MEVVTINGVDYIKASVLARRFKYTNDYVGQLCRSRKVDAQLVGRTWYVNPLSVEEHKNLKTTKQLSKVSSRGDEKKFTYKVDINKSRLNVPSVLTRTTAKSLASLEKDKNFLQRINWKAPKYEPDQADLMPILESTGTAISLPVNPAEALTVNVKGHEVAAIMEPTSMPAIAMTGEIKVGGLEDSFNQDTSKSSITFDDIASKNKLLLSIKKEIDSTEKSVEESNKESKIDRPKGSSEVKDPVYPVKIKRLNSLRSPAADLKILETETGLDKSINTEQAADHQSSALFTPTLVLKQMNSKENNTLALVKGSSRGLPVISVLIWTSVFLLLVLGLLILGLERFEVTTTDSSQSGWRWQVDIF